MDNNNQPTPESEPEQLSAQPPVVSPSEQEGPNTQLPETPPLTSTPNPFSAFPSGSVDTTPMPTQAFATGQGLFAPKKSKKKLVIIIAIIVVVLALAAAAAWYFFLQPKPASKSVVKAVTTTKTTTVASGSWLTYVAQDTSKLLVTDSQQKTIATLPLPSGESNFTVLANNNKNVLVEAESATTTTAPKYYQIGVSGQAVALSSAVAQTLTTLNLSDISFTTKGDLLYTNCGDTTCSLLSLNLSTGTATTLTTVAYAKPTHGSTSESGSLLLLGASDKDVAYYVQGQTSQTLVTFDVATQKATQTLPMTVLYDGTNVPVLSPDDASIIYDSDVSSGTVTTTTIEIMNTTTGKLTSIPGGSMHPNVSTVTATPFYVWSPDSTKAAFAGGQAADVSPVDAAIAYVDVATGKVVTVKDFGKASINQLTAVGGWASATQLNFSDVTSASGNYSVDGKTTDYAVDVTTNTVTQNPTPAGYRLVTINSQA